VRLNVAQYYRLILFLTKEFEGKKSASHGLDSNEFMEFYYLMVLGAKEKEIAISLF